MPQPCHRVAEHPVGLFADRTRNAACETAENWQRLHYNRAANL
jgi:hypothetical protein